MTTVEDRVELAPLTTVKLGGAAKFFWAAKSESDLKTAFKWAQKKGMPVHILGGGSNTIFSDKGFDGLVVQVGLEGKSIDEKTGLVRVQAGEDWDELVSECVSLNLAGIECMSGIPGLVGATPVQNVGAYGQQVSDVVTKVKALDRESLKEVSFKNSECGFRYRDSRFKGKEPERYIITEVIFQLRPNGAPTIKYPQVQEIVGGKPTLSEVRKAVLNLRRKKSMVVSENDPNSRSCGSFFVNPVMSEDKLAEVKERYKKLGGTDEVPVFEEGAQVKIPAAWLVEQAGFTKGMRRGGVGISPNHALALVNYDGTTKELLALAGEIQAAVKEKFDIELTREPVVV